MCFFIAEIVMLVGGIYALFKGKVKLTTNITLEGWQARVAGLFLISPLPLAVLIGFLVGFLVGIGAIPPSSLDYLSYLDILLILFGLLGAVVFGVIVNPKEEKISEDTSSPFN